MANIVFTNEDAYAQLDIYKDQGNGGNRYVDFSIPKDSTLSIDEGDISPVFHKDLQNALKSGQATIDLDELDALTSLEVKGFLAKGLDLDYKLSKTALSEGNVVALETSTNKVKKVAVEGDQPFGVMYEDATSADLYVKVKFAGEVTAVADGTIKVGDKLIATTAGKIKASTSIGKYYLGVSGSDVGNGESITFQITPGVI